MKAIQFIAVPDVDATVSFSYFPDYPDESTTVTIVAVFKVVRLAAGQVSIAANILAQAVVCANCLNLDYPPAVTFSVIGDMVVINVANGSPVFGFTASGPFANLVTPQINNTIHIINFSPRRYAIPANMQRNHLLTENGLFLTTEDGKKIRL